MTNNRKALRWAAILLAFLVLLAIAVMILITTEPARRWALSRVAAALAEQGVSFRSESLSIHPLALGATLKNAVFATKGQGTRPFAKAARVDVRLAPSLWRGEVGVSVELDSLAIDIAFGPEGSSNLPSLPKQDQPAATSSVTVNRIRILNGSIRVHDGDAAVALPRWNADATRLPDGSYRVAAQNTANGSFSWAGRSAAVEQLKIDADLGSGQVLIRSAELGAAGQRLALNGQFNHTEQTARLHISAAGALEPLAALMNADIVRGAYESEFDVTGKLAAPSAAGRMKVTGAAWKQVGPVDGESRIGYNGQSRVASFDDLYLRWGAAQVAARGNYRVGDPWPAELSGSFHGLSTAQLERVSGSRLPISSTLAGNFSGRGGDFTSRLTLTPRAAVPLPQQIPLAATLTARLHGASLAVQIEEASAAGVQAQGEVAAASGGALSGALTLSAGNLLDTLTSLTAASVLPASLSGVELRGPLTAQVTLSGTAAKPAATIVAQSASLHVAPGITGELNLSGTIDPQRLVIEQMRLQAGSQISASASGSLEGAAISFRGTMAHPSIQQALATAGQADSVAGLDGPVQVTWEALGTTAAPVLRAQVRSPGLVLFSQPLGALTAELGYGEGRFTARPLTLQQVVGGGTIRVGGSFTPSTGAGELNAILEAYRLDSLLPPGSTTPLRAVLDGSMQLQGASIASLTGQAALSVKDAAAANREIGRADLQATFAASQLRASLTVPAYGFAGELTTPLAPASALAQFTARLNQTPLAALTPDATGFVTATASGSFNRSDPLGSLRATGEVQNAEASPVNPSFARATVRLASPAPFAYDGGVLTLPGISLQGPANSRLSARGTMPLAGGGSGALHIDADANLAALSEAVPLLDAGSPGGNLVVNLDLTGTATAWRPAGSITLAGGELFHPSLPSPITGAGAQLRFAADRVELALANVKWLGGDLQAAGHAPLSLLMSAINGAELSPTAPFELTATAQGIRLENLPGAAERALSGEASFQATLTGAGLDRDGWTGTLEATALRARLGQAEFTQRTPLRVSLRNQLATLEPFEVAGPESNLRLRGSLSLRPPNPLAMRVTGQVNAALAQLFTTQLRAEGDLNIDAALTGTLDRPRAGGRIEIAGLSAESAAVQAAVEEARGVIEFEGSEARVTGLKGYLNGGAFESSGTVSLNGRDISAADLRLTAKDTTWNVPEGLQTAANLDLRFNGRPGQFAATGTVTILNGAYREALVLERGLLNVLAPSPVLAADVNSGEPPAPVRLDIAIRTEEPIAVANDLLNGDVSTNLRVTGTTAQPGLVGRLDLAEGAVLYLGGRNYVIDRGALAFNNQRQIEPTLDINGRTRAGGVDITLRAQGTVGQRLETTFTSDPPLSQPDILSLLVSGRRLKDTRGAEADIVGDQALSYLSGNLASTVSQRANRALKFNFVRIDPGLIADEAEPTARLTLGQDLTDRVGLIYSVNLRNSSDQIWIGRAELTRRLEARTVRQSDNSYRFQFQHGFEMGGTPAPQSARKQGQALRVGQVTVNIEGLPTERQRQLAGKAGVKTGKPFDFLAFRGGVNRIRQTLIDSGYPEVRLRTNREESGGVLNVAITGAAGPRVEFVFEGSGITRAMRRSAGRAWAESSFDSLRIRQATDALQRPLFAEGHFTAEADALVDRRGDVKRVVFTVTAGRRFNDVEIDLPGSKRPGEVLTAVAPSRAQRREGAAKPLVLRDRILSYYRSQGFADASAGQPQVDKAQADLRIRIPVNEGAALRFGELTMAGNQQLSAEAARQAMQWVAGQPYLPAQLSDMKTRLEAALAALDLTGYEVKLSPVRRGEFVDVAAVLDEGRKNLLSEVTVEGNQHVSDRLIRSQIGIKPGEAVTEGKLNQARQNLYSTGAFVLADLETRGTGTSGPVGLLARVREVRPIEVRYGMLFDTERGVGGILDFAMRNLLGSARTAGVRGRYDSRLQEARTYFEQPSLLSLPVKLVTTGFVRRELNQVFLTDRTGGSAYLDFRWKKAYQASFGYRFEQVHTFERKPDPVFPFDIRIRVAPLTAGFSRDTRDDAIDASRGSFTSHVGEWAPATLGSQLQYGKYFGQYAIYRGLGKASEVPWSGAVRQRYVLAASARYGIAAGLAGQDLVPSERFYSGGANSVRGFRQDFLGPVAGNTPLGGESLLVFNGEFRTPLYRFFDAVGFVDAGNVVERWRDLRLADLRLAGGAGLRVRTPYFLIRMDYGWVFNRRANEPSGRFSIGIGQSF